jgi:hypothetical protein
MARNTSIVKQSQQDIVKLSGMSGNISTPTCSIPFENSLTYNGYGDLYYQRDSQATFINRTTRLLQTVNIDEARFEQDGLLLEGPSQNYCIWSTDFSRSAWSKTNMSIDITNIPNSVKSSPTARFDATKFIANSNISAARLSYGFSLTDSVIDANVVSFSIFVKFNTKVRAFELLINKRNPTSNVTGKAKFILDFSPPDQSDNPDFGYITADPTITNDTNTTVIDTNIDNLTNGWSRISITVQFDSISPVDAFDAILSPWPTVNNQIDSSGTNMTFVAYGAQVERRCYATSFIPTNGAVATRSEDLLRIQTDRNLPHISYNYTVAMDIKMKGKPLFSNPVIFRTGNLNFDNSEEQHRIIRFNSGASNGVGAFEIYPGSTQSVNLPTFFNPKGRNRIGFRRSSLETSVFMNGRILGKDSTFQHGNGARDWMWFGSYGSAQHFDGNISQIRIYDKALSDNEIYMV